MSAPVNPPPAWATGGGASVTEPGSGKKSIGWIFGELPPASTFNWLALRTYQWLTYIANVLSSADGSWSLNNTIASAAVAAYRVTATPEAHGGGNGFKPLFTALAGTNRPVTLWSGKLSDNIAFLVTSNVYWDTPTQRWTQQLNTKDSSAIILHESSGVIVSTVAAGSPSWATWPTNRVDVGVTANKFTATGNISAVGSITAASAALSGNLDVDGNLDVGGNLRLLDGSTFTYENPRTITRYIDARASTIAGTITYDGTTPASFSGGPGAIVIPLEPYLPRGAVITQLRAWADTTAGGAALVGIYRNALSFSTGPTSAVAMLSTGTVATSGSSAQALVFTPNQNATVSGNASAFVVVTLTNSDVLFYPQIELTFTVVNPMVAE